MKHKVKSSLSGIKFNVLSFLQPKKDNEKFATGIGMKSVCLNTNDSVDLSIERETYVFTQIEVKTRGNLLIV